MKQSIMRSPKQFALISVVAVAILAVFLGSVFFVNSERSYPGKMGTITIGTPPLESSALIYIAEHQGFFTGYGLSVTVKDYDTGAASLNGLLKGEVDIAVPAEYALVGKGFKKEKLRAITSIDKVQYFYLIGRKDRGIENISGLEGKKIGVVRKTIAEFYLGRFLELHGMNMEQVAPVNINISQSEDVIMNGDIDAIISRPPYVSAIEKRLGKNAIIWPVQSSQALYAIMIGRNNWISEHPEPVKRLMSSLVKAEEYIIRYPDKARAIVQNKLNSDDTYMAAVWSQNQFALSLDQSLITAMEDEARWMIKNNLTTEKAIPDFLDYLYADGLKAVKPEAVNIIQ